MNYNTINLLRFSCWLGGFVLGSFVRVGFVGEVLVGFFCSGGFGGVVLVEGFWQGAEVWRGGFGGGV